MLEIRGDGLRMRGPAGWLDAPRDDVVLRKLAMLYEGECEGLGPKAAATRFGFSRQRYFQLRQSFKERGTRALMNRKRGPRRHYRRTEQVIREVARLRLADPSLSAADIARRLRRMRCQISLRSVHRTLAQLGLARRRPRAWRRVIHDPPGTGSSKGS